MKMGSLSKKNRKQEFRNKYLKIRSSIPLLRSEEAKKKLTEFVRKTVSSASLVLSFSSIDSEIETYDVNNYLLAEGKLVLPRVSKNKLLFYKVGSIDDLYPNSLSILEPPSVPANLVNTDEIEIALVPGLAFDQNKNRLGYGKGFYDRCLIDFKGRSIGVGFKEQLSQQVLPTEPHDKRVCCLKLF